MSYFTMGVYWKSRPLTLREYASSTKDFLLLLRKIHPLFANLEWVGNRPNSAVKLTPDLQNLDSLIYENAGGNQQVYDQANVTGMPTWESTGRLGYRMRYDTGRACSAGGVTLGIGAGAASKEKIGFDTVTISFPLSDHPEFPHREFYQYDFIKHLFLELIRFWNPDDGLVFSHDFANIVNDEGPPLVGWLTYLRDERALALRNDCHLRDGLIEPVEPHGVLITLSKEIVSPENLDQIATARYLRNLLIKEKFIAL